MRLGILFVLPGFNLCEFQEWIVKGRKKKRVRTGVNIFEEREAAEGDRNDAGAKNIINPIMPSNEIHCAANHQFLCSKSFYISLLRSCLTAQYYSWS